MIFSRYLVGVIVVVIHIAYPFDSTAYGIDVLHGLGAIGDSASGATTTNSPPVILQSTRGLNFGPGLSYDFAHFNADSFNVLSPGSQVDQLVAQVAAGNVTLGFIAASINDLLPNGAAIANGSLSGVALANFENTLVQNVETAANSVLAAGGRLVLSGFSDVVDDPTAAAIAADPVMKARAEGVINTIDTQLLAFANSQGIPFINLFELQKSIFDSGSFVVGGVSINLTQAGTDPHDFFVDSLNGGTVVRAEIANLWLEAMNKGFGTAVPLLTDQEILTLAGIGGEYTGVESFSTATNLSQFATPEPSSMTLSAIGLALWTCGRIRRLRRRSRL